MPERMESLEALEALQKKGKVEEHGVGDAGVPVKDKWGRAYATGRRKCSVARVWVKDGSGSFTVNGKDVGSYFSRVAQSLVYRPLSVLDSVKSFDVVSTVAGGGISGQAGALRHGLSRALALFDPSTRILLKSEGFLTRDSRVVESKKYGRRKARRKPQFTKR